MHPNYRTAKNHAEEARSLACDLLRKIDDANRGEASDSDIEMITSEINRHLIATEHAINTPRTSANRMDMTANALIENTIESAATAEHAQDLLNEIQDYRRRATANGESAAEQDHQIAWHLENALAANLTPHQEDAR